MPQSLDHLRSEADRLLAARDVDAAIAAHRALLERDPADHTGWFNLGWLLGQTGQLNEGLEAYDSAIKAGASGEHEIRTARAALLTRAHREEEALEELERALSLTPSHGPALLNAGNIREDRGEREKARALYERALRADPRSALAFARLLAVTDFENVDAPLLQQAWAALRSGQLADGDAADIGFAAGAAFDRLGAYEAAWESYTRANAAAHRMHAAAGRSFDAAQVRAFTDRSIAAFTQAPAGRQGEEAPIFILGLFRSGSTLLEQILSAHPQVDAGGELEIIPRLSKDIGPLSSEAVGTARSDYLAQARTLGLGEGLFTDKQPDNFRHVGLIKTLFPSARILHTVREPVDNLLSLYFLHLGGDRAYAADLESLAIWHREHVRLMSHWKSLYGEDIIDVSYDNLVAEPEPVIRDVLSRVGLPFDEACLAPHRNRNSVRTASVWQVREAIHTRSSGRARNYERWLGPLREALAASQNP